MPSPPGPGADAAYGRALAAYDRKAYDEARRAALDALAQNPQHGGARALLARIDVARRAAPYQSSPSSGGGTTRGTGPEAISTDPTILISRASAPAAAEPIDQTVLVNRDDLLKRLTDPHDAPAGAPHPRPAAAPAASERTLVAPSVPRSVPPRPRSSPSVGGRAPSFWQRLRRTGNRPATPARHSPRHSRPASDRRPGRLTPGLRGALIAVAAVVVAALFVWGAILAARWFFPAGQVLTLTRPVGGTITGPGLRCGTRGSDCSTSRPTGEDVTLETQADDRYVFSGFTGDCAPTGRTTMRGPRTCGARFDSVAEGPSAVTFPLTITKPTGGTVVGPDILCGSLDSTCSVQIPSGSSVTLRYQADPGFTFSQFTGDCAPKGETVMTAARTCSAMFTPATIANVEPSGPAGPSVSRPPRPPVTSDEPSPGSRRAPPVSAPPAPPRQPTQTTQAAPTPTAPPSSTAGTPPESPMPTAADKPAPPPITVEEHAKNEILQLVKNYCAEYETMKPDRIQKLFPLIDQKVLRDRFKEYKSLKCTITAPPEYDRLDARPAGGAQIKFGMKQVIQMKSSGAPQAVETIVTMVVSRTDLRSDWLIDRVQHEPKPKP